MASFSSSLSVCQHHILFYTTCSHHMAKEHQLLFCCPLSQRHISPLACPIFISIDSFVLFSVQETLSILPYILHRHQFSAPLLLSLSMSHNHRVSPERSLCLQFLFLSADSRV